MTRVLICVAFFVSVPWSAAQSDEAKSEESKHHVERLFPTETWATASALEMGMREDGLREASRYALTGGGAGIILRHGRVVSSWGDTKKKFDLKSTSKSIGVTALGLAIDDGTLRLDDLASNVHPSFAIPPESNRQTGWIDKITLRHLATQTAGFDKPGGYTPLLFAPGTRWHYSDGGPNWLAECVTLAMKRDIESLLFDRIFTPIGITKNDLHWRKNQYRDATIDQYVRCEFGSGVHANVDAMARIGLLYLNGGSWRDRSLLSRSFVDAVRRPDPGLANLQEWDDGHGDAARHYGLLWWNNADRTLTDVPEDAYWSWGLYDSLIVVIPSLDIVVARAGASWKRRPTEKHYDVLRPFLGPIARSVDPPPESDDSARDLSAAPYPPSKVARGVHWDPPQSIRRAATGSDNWPITWMDDDSLFTAYGDGWGFTPKVKQKLSLGFARRDRRSRRLSRHQRTERVW